MGTVVLTGVSKEDLELTGKFSETGLSAQQFADSLNKAHELVGKDLVEVPDGLNSAQADAAIAKAHSMPSASEVSNAILTRYKYDNLISNQYFDPITFGLLAANTITDSSSIFRSKGIQVSNTYIMDGRASVLSSSTNSYIIPSGMTTGTAGFHINIKNGSVPGFLMHVIYYTSTGSYISNQSVSIASIIGYQFVKLALTIPATTVSFRIGLTTAAVTSATVELGSFFVVNGTIIDTNLHYSSSDYRSISSKFVGKKLALLGDSITAPIDAYYSYMAKELRMSKTIVNKAISGYTLSSSGSVGSICTQVDDLVANYNSTDFDVIIINGGTNDYHAQFTLGDVNTQSSVILASVDKTTVAGAMRYILEKLYVKFPAAKIIVGTPIQRWNNIDATKSIKLLDYNNTIVEMAKYGSVSCFDAFRYAGIVSWFEIENANGKYLIDGLHPNSAGKIKMGEFYTSQMSIL